MENEINGTVVSQEPVQITAQPVQISSQQPIKQKKYWWKFFGMFILWTLFGLLVSRLIPILLLYKWISWMASDFKDSVSTSTINENQASWLYKMSWYAWWWDNYNYSLYAVDNYEESLSLSTNDYPWLKGLYPFNEYIYLDLTFDNGELVNWKIVDRENENDLWDPENINRVTVVWDDHVNKISEHLWWQKFKVEEDDLIYNDTNNKQTIRIIDTWWEEKDSVQLEPWKYYINDDMWSIEAIVK